MDPEKMSMNNFKLKIKIEFTCAYNAITNAFQIQNIHSFKFLFKFTQKFPNITVNKC